MGGVLLIIRLGVTMGRNYKTTEGTLGSQQRLITALLTRVYMMERILQEAGIVNFGFEDDEVQGEVKKLMAK